MDTATALKPTLSAPGERPLLTPSLRLRAICADDVDHYVSLLTNAEVMKFIGVDQGKLPTSEEIKEIVLGAVAAWKKRGYGRWSIFERASGEFVGFTGFRCEAGVPELISVVHERFWGNGYAYEAGRVCIDHAFATLGFNKVIAVSRPANTRARTLIERLGFEFEGIIDFHGVEGAAYRLDRD